MSGYSGYVANTLEPNLSDCSKQDTNNKNNFNLYFS